MNMCTWVLNAILAFATRRSLRVVERACDVVPNFTTRWRQGQVKRDAVLASVRNARIGLNTLSLAGSSRAVCNTEAKVTK